MSFVNYQDWKHVFKLDPDKPVTDEALERLCMSGTDAIVVGGTTGVTFDNTVDLLARIRQYELPCVLEISNQEAIVPGFDYFFVPVVFNAQDPDWIIGQHHRAIKEYGAVLDWSLIVPEAYIILNGQSAAARLTNARTDLGSTDVTALARLAERMFHMPIVYIEYSGIYGDMNLVRSAVDALDNARLFYGGGIDNAEKAREAARCADTVVVGNIIYENLEQALLTVAAVHQP